MLGVNRETPEAEVHAAYLRAAKRAHPDLNRDDPDAEQRFRSVVEAYDKIRAERTRRKTNAETIRRRRAVAEAEEAARQSRRRRQPLAAPQAGTRSRYTEALIVSLLWFLAVMIILAVM